MRTLRLPALLLALAATAACSQTPQDEQTSLREPTSPDTERPASRPDLYDCEGCEAVHEHPLDDLDWRVTIPPEGEPGEPLVLTGRVLQPDGRAPAPGVVLYLYHTNAEGVYPQRGDETGWGRRHGYLRGWLRTDAEGRYAITTIRPGSYPSATEPAHVHVTVKEPGRQEYWIDSFHFEGDPLLTPSVRSRLEKRGGSGITRLTCDEEGTWQGTRDIVLEG